MGVVLSTTPLFLLKLTYSSHIMKFHSFTSTLWWSTKFFSHKGYKMEGHIDGYLQTQSKFEVAWENITENLNPKP